MAHLYFCHPAISQLLMAYVLLIACEELQVTQITQLNLFAFFFFLFQKWTSDKSSFLEWPSIFIMPALRSLACFRVLVCQLTSRIKLKTAFAFRLLPSVSGKYLLFPRYY